MKTATGLFGMVWLLLVSTVVGQVAENPWQPDSRLPSHDFFESVCLAKMITGSSDQLGLIIPSYRKNPKSIVAQVCEMRTESRVRQVQLNDGTVGTEEYSVTVPQMKEVAQTVMVSEATGTRRIDLSLSKVQVWDWSLKQLAEEQIRARLSKARHVVLIHHPMEGNKPIIGSYYRSVLSPDILFVYAAPLDLAAGEMQMSVRPSAE